MIDQLKEDNYEYQHEALKIRLKDGSSYVMDLAGAQFGYNIPVMPYDTYVKTMVAAKSIPTVNPFGYMREYVVKACTSPSIPLDPRCV